MARELSRGGSSTVQPGQPPRSKQLCLAHRSLCPSRTGTWGTGGSVSGTFWCHGAPESTYDETQEGLRVIMDLSWPPGSAVNDGIDTESYLDGPGTIALPTIDYMEQRLLALDPGAFLYKTDLARGYLTSGSSIPRYVSALRT